MKKFNYQILSSVFWISLTLSLAVVFLDLIFPKPFQAVTSHLRSFLGESFGWYYLVIVTFMVIICFYLILSPASKIKIGDPKSKPEHSKLSWLAMLFSAGMGIGLVFYGAAEPLSHYAVMAPEAQLYSREALRDSLKYSFFHYGFHAWAIYAIVGLSLAYFQFRKKETTLISVTLKPIFGTKTDGLLGKIIDSITIFSTVVGVSTTLGYGASQINGGLNYLFHIPNNKFVQILIIVIATFLFILSALSGIGNGVKILSNINILVATILMVLVLLIGPKVEIMNTMVSTFGYYLNDFFRMSFRTAPGNPAEQEWIQKWTILYWAWWISWSPFVGVFIARISKGRTIREFISHVLLIPSAFSFLWFSVFGVISTEAARNGANIAVLPIEKMLFGTLKEYPFGMFLSIIAMFLVFSFFITSADSATYVLAMQSEHGSLHPHNIVKVTWGVILSAIAAILLVNGGLDALQNVLIIVAFPFSIILILLVVSLLTELHYERHKMGLYLTPKVYPSKNKPFRSYEENETE